MIVDIIPMPIRIPPNEDIDMVHPLWIETSDGGEDVIATSRNFVSCSDIIHRYKIIDTFPCGIIETVVCAIGTEYGALNLRTLSSTTNTGPIPLMPVLTKVHTITPTDIHTSAYRHLPGIKTLIDEHEFVPLRSSAKRTVPYAEDSLLSIHQLFIAAVAASMHKYNRIDYSTALIAFATRNRARLHMLLSANEEDNCTLLSNIHHLSGGYTAELFDAEDMFVAMIDSMSQLPQASPHDTVTRVSGGRGYVDSTWLRPHLSPEYTRRMYSANTPESDVHDVSKSAYSPPQDLGNYVSPILNMMELMPYTDISITFRFGERAKIDYAHSVFGNVRSAQTDITKNLFTPAKYSKDGAARSTGAVSLLNMSLAIEAFAIAVNSLYNERNCPYGVSPKFKIALDQVECRVVKTFREEVYIDVLSVDGQMHLQFYFDLTMYALGTNGLMDIRTVNSVVESSDKFWQYLNQIHPLQ